MRRKLKNKNTRKIFKSGSSYAITLPIEIVRELKWKEKQKIVVKKKGKGISIIDWE
ncbi:AbrB/MazE/SpoVT family DNA-binding domain-containing protein [Patescibacteria group bacterium]